MKDISFSVDTSVSYAGKNLVQWFWTSDISTGYSTDSDDKYHIFEFWASDISTGYSTARENELFSLYLEQPVMHFYYVFMLLLYA